MLHIHSLVALVAITNRLFAWFVWIVATLARHRRVHGKPLDSFGGLEGPVATRAVPSAEDLGLRAVDMARVAIHGHAIEVDVGQRCLVFVALSAHPGVRGFKSLVRRVVTFVAFETFVDDVLRMPWRKADPGPALRHGAGGSRCALILDRRNDVGGEL